MKFYYCKHCKNLELVINDGGPVPVCCGEPMGLLTANTTDAATEKHVPIIQAAEQGINIRVGEVDHPMTTEHYIQWIAVTDGKNVEIKHLDPTDQPTISSHFKITDKFSVYAYCNLHGLWMSEN